MCGWVLAWFISPPCSPHAPHMHPTCVLHASRMQPPCISHAAVVGAFGSRSQGGCSECQKSSPPRSVHHRRSSRDHRTSHPKGKCRPCAHAPVFLTLAATACVTHAACVHARSCYRVFLIIILRACAHGKITLENVYGLSMCTISFRNLKPV